VQRRAWKRNLPRLFQGLLSGTVTAAQATVAGDRPDERSGPAFAARERGALTARDGDIEGARRRGRRLYRRAALG
jgi:hypothetical protein